MLAEGGGRQALLAKAVGPPMPLLEAAARVAFHTLPDTMLSRIAKALGVDIAKPQDTWAKITSLVKYIIPGIGDSELLNIMKQRLVQSNRGMESLSILSMEA
eukprot:3081810-Lingulodinium_polyedra.AAC.1